MAVIAMAINKASLVEDSRLNPVFIVFSGGDCQAEEEQESRPFVQFLGPLYTRLPSVPWMAGWSTVGWLGVTIAVIPRGDL